jgi:hypothetical protein
MKLTVDTVIKLVKAGRYGTPNMFGNKWFANDELMTLLREHDMMNAETMAKLKEAGIDVPNDESEG